MTSISTRALAFENWTNSPENYNKAIVENKKVEEFKMFDFQPSTYSSDLKEFAQDYIDLHDKDGDRNWDRDEFISMALAQDDISLLKDTHYFIGELTKYYEQIMEADDLNKDNSWSKDEFLNYYFNALDIDRSKLSAEELQGWNVAFDNFNKLNLDNDPDHLSAAELAIASNISDMPKLNEMYADYVSYEDAGKLFDRLNIDNDNTRISAEEYASELYLSDLNYETYGATGNIAAALDGKLDYANFQSLPFLEGSSKEFIDGEKLDFYNNFYAN